jgi:hypothetical protein
VRTTIRKLRGTRTFIRQIFLSGFCRTEEEITSATGWGAYTLETWRTPTYHERLKQSYYLLQQVFAAAE